ncbi:TPA: hypothetical protein ACHK2V_005264, partial [Escherichia coli]
RIIDFYQVKYNRVFYTKIIWPFALPGLAFISSGGFFACNPPVVGMAEDMDNGSRLAFSWALVVKKYQQDKRRLISDD